VVCAKQLRFSSLSDRQFKLTRLFLIGGSGLFLFWLPTCWAAPAAGDALKTRAELSNYEETSRYADVLDFLGQLDKSSPLVNVHTFGRSYEGSNLPLAVIAEPPVASLEEARRSGKVTVLVFGNIHAGEVDGKEASLEIARRLAGGDLRHLLKKVIVLIAPIYNADSNDRISVTNRTDQNGPIRGVGARANAQGLDLNRDFMKIEAPETMALIRLINEWDPLLTVDLHTTDGSFHGYHLTYSTPLNPSGDETLLDYHREKMMPALTKAMQRDHGFRTYFYGNFASEESLARQSIFAGGRDPGPNQPRIWRAFSPQPRIAFNYVGLRNRLCILSESYSHLDFRRRIEVTAAFIEEILSYTAAHASEIRRLSRQADARMTGNGRTRRIGVEYAPQALDKPVPILVGKVVGITNPISGVEITAMVENAVTPVSMPDYGLFTATRTVPIAPAYFIPRQEELRVVVEKLRTHGITVEELAKPLTTKVEAFRIVNVSHASGRLQGRDRESVKVSGDYEQKEMSFGPGTYVVRTSQPLGLLAAYLLEPESDDGLVTWNYLDSLIGPQKVLPIYKLMTPRVLKGL